jgi:hypothetical protein
MYYIQVHRGLQKITPASVSNICSARNEGIGQGNAHIVVGGFMCLLRKMDWTY